MVYLIPTFLYENALEALPAYILEAVEKCDALFAENERSARRYLKQLKKEIVIDHFDWFTIGKAEQDLVKAFRECLQKGQTVGIISEAGCPGVADPGQLLVGVAQELGAVVRPLVGPSSILLALMASGMNGQRFAFVGYLPIDHQQRVKAIRELEAESKRAESTQIFIETPYRNNQMLETLLKTCHPATKICVAVNITGPDETIRTLTVQQWKLQSLDLHKKPAIFLLKA